MSHHRLDPRLNRVANLSSSARRGEPPEDGGPPDSVLGVC